MMESCKILNFRIFILFILCFLSCKGIPVEKAVEIKQTENKLSVIFRVFREKGVISKINVPISFNIKNTTFEERDFSKVNYLYRRRYKGGTGVPLYIKDGDRLSLIRNKRQKRIEGKKSREYAVYTIHFPDTNALPKDRLKYYTNKILASNVDTLAVGTLQEFKKKEPEFVERLLKNDTLKFNFNDFERTKDWIPIKIPVSF